MADRIPEICEECKGHGDFPDRVCTACEGVGMVYPESAVILTKKKRIDIMVDLETLGTDYNAPIFQVASAAFDIDTGETVKNYEGFGDIAELTEADGIINGGTLKWWLSTDKELLTELLDKGEVSPAMMLRKYHVWLTKLTDEYEDVYLWGNGILFDNAILRHKFESLGFTYPINFRNDRDVRTIFELAQAKSGESSKEMYARIYDDSLARHDAMNDVNNQIALVAECYRMLMK